LCDQATDAGAEDENDTDRECTPDSGLQDVEWAPALAFSSGSHPMNCDAKHDATVESDGRAREREEINVAPGAKSLDWNCDAVNQEQRAADQGEGDRDGEESNHNPGPATSTLVDGVVRHSATSCVPLYHSGCHSSVLATY
jgi:hypothetical protein